jgi:hypothetical protein
MTDYNDGKWHGWNGGECPVHPESVVEAVWYHETSTGIAGKFDCYVGSRFSIIAFRVTKPYREPREFYVREITCFDLDGNVTGKVYQQCTSKDNPAFLVREVIE